MKKLKKAITFIVSISLLATFSACGKDESLPEGMSQELYDTGVNVLKVMDKYNDMNLNVEEAEERLDALNDKIDNMNLSDEPNKGEIWSESSQALMIQSDINSFNYALYCSKYDKENKSSDTYTIADELRERLELD